MEDTGSSRRRRGAGIVTANACTECRKKRAKCDGSKPCHRCMTQNAECIYERPVRQSKETMRNEIEQLQNHRRQSERVFSALSSGTYAQETLNRLKNGESLEDISNHLQMSSSEKEDGSANVSTINSSSHRQSISDTLKLAESSRPFPQSGSDSATTSSINDSGIGQHTWNVWGSESSSPYSFVPEKSQEGDAMNWEPQPHPPRPETAQSSSISGLLLRPCHEESTNDSLDDHLKTARGRGQHHILGSSNTNEEDQSFQQAPSKKWSNVAPNSEMVEHFLTLYFCWEYPSFASLSKEHFLTDYRSGRQRYCSPLLVNAMLALGCRFSNLPQSRADPDDSTTSGDHYFAEAKRLLIEDDHQSLTAIQTMGLMSIREASCGRETESYHFAGQAIRLAVQIGLHIQAMDERVGVDDMEHEVRAATLWGAFALDEAWSLSVGRIPHFSRTAQLVSKPAIIDIIESSEWVPYTDQGAPEIRAANQPSNVRSVYKCFCELSELVHQALYRLYTPGKQLTSNDLLSIYTRYLNWYSALPEALRLGHNFTPAVLFVHMYYHYAILLLFRPFIDLQFTASAVSPIDVCSQAAEAITTLVRSYDQLYTLQRTPSFVPYIVLASSVMHLVTMKKNKNSGPLLQGVADLKDMRSCHGFSGRGLNILRFLAQNWGIENPLGEDDPPSKEEILKMCGPLSASLNLFCPNLSYLILNQSPSSGMALFAPFPMQGLPLLSDESKLERNGFSKII